MYFSHLIVARDWSGGFGWRGGKLRGKGGFYFCFYLSFHGKCKIISFHLHVPIALLPLHQLQIHVKVIYNLPSILHASHPSLPSISHPCLPSLIPTFHLSSLPPSLPSLPSIPRCLVCSFYVFILLQTDLHTFFLMLDTINFNFQLDQYLIFFFDRCNLVISSRLNCCIN